MERSTGFNGEGDVNSWRTGALRLQRGPEFGEASEQHQGFSIRELAEAKGLVERPCSTVERLDDDSARTDEIGGGKSAPGGVDDQVRTESAALIVGVHGELA